MSGQGKEIPVAPIDRILHQEGGNRVSEEAAKALRDYVENIARLIAREAGELARHAGRKTITRDDVEFAAKRILKLFNMGL